MKALLKEIGGKNYFRALEDLGEIYVQQKPLAVPGHYLEYECDTGNVWLYYRYSGGSVIKILQVNGFWHVPKNGWEMVTKHKDLS